MSLYPDVQEKARAEIQHVCGNTRLPEIADMGSLPYTVALVHEVLRWHVVLPLSLVHVSIEDDQYDGYFIPKGSIVIPNAWFVSYVRVLPHAELTQMQGNAS